MYSTDGVCSLSLFTRKCKNYYLKKFWGDFSSLSKRNVALKQIAGGGQVWVMQPPGCSWLKAEGWIGAGTRLREEFAEMCRKSLHSYVGWGQRDRKSVV